MNRGSRRCLCLALLLLGCLLVAPGRSQQDTVWVRQLAGTGNADERVCAVASDPVGFIYAAAQVLPGDSTSYLVTHKYDSAGGLCWSRRFGTGLRAVPFEIVAGNSLVAVTGTIETPDFDTDIFTTIYTVDGDSCWTRYYDVDEGNDVPAALSLDGDSCLYLAGTCEPSEELEDIALVKYSASGAELWSRLYDFQENEDFARAMARDSDGFIYIAGSVCNWEAGGDMDVVTLKYDRSGALQWSKAVRGLGESNDSAEAVSVTPAGDVWVCGTVTVDYDTSGLVVLKLSPAGESLWSKRELAAGSRNRGVGVVADASGGCTVAGDLYGEFWLARYDSSGTELWRTAHHWPGDDDTLSCMVCDYQGNTYMAGGSSDDLGSGRDVALVKVSPSGETAWTRLWTGEELGAQALCMVLAKSESPVLGGFIARDLDTNGLLLRFGQDGSLPWQQQVNEPGTRGAGSASDVAFASDGDVVAAGWLENYNGYRDMAVAAFTEAGELRWLDTLGSLTDSADEAVAVCVDSAGCVYATGFTHTGTSGQDYITAKWSADGDRQWSRLYSGPGVGVDRPAGIDVGAGLVVVTGTSDNAESGTAIATVAYDTAGRLLWVDRYPEPADTSECEGVAVEFDTSGATYVCGTTRENGVGQAVVLKYDGLGNRVWRVICEDPDSSYTMFIPKGMSVLPGGIVDVGGEGHQSFIAARFTDAGETLWTRRAGFQVSCDAFAAKAGAAGRFLCIAGRAPTYSNRDFLIVAFDSLGREAWRDSFDLAGRADAYRDLAAWGSGFAVTGDGGLPGGAQTVSAMYDSVGQTVWLGVCRRTSFWRRATTTGCGHALDGCQQVVGRARRAGVFRQTPSAIPGRTFRVVQGAGHCGRHGRPAGSRRKCASQRSVRWNARHALLSEPRRVGVIQDRDPAQRLGRAGVSEPVLEYDSGPSPSAVRRKRTPEVLRRHWTSRTSHQGRRSDLSRVRAGLGRPRLPGHATAERSVFRARGSGIRRQTLAESVRRQLQGDSAAGSDGPRQPRPVVRAG